MNRQTKEIIIKYIFLLFALVSVIVLGLIVFSLFREGLPIFGKGIDQGFSFRDGMVSHL